MPEQEWHLCSICHHWTLEPEGTMHPISEFGGLHPVTYSNEQPTEQARRILGALHNMSVATNGTSKEAT